MCFSPSISLTTAILEYIFGGLILLLYKRSNMRIPAASFLILLGSYQLTEFFLCITSNFRLWGSAGFIMYTFIPAVGLHGVCYFLKKRCPTIVVYLPALLSSLLIVVYTPFVTSGMCHSVFVTVKTAIFPPTNTTGLILCLLYTSYYATFILIGGKMLTDEYVTQKNSGKKRVVGIMLLSFTAMTIPTFVLLIVLPSLAVMFPSILCQFALLLALLLFISVSTDESLLKEKN